MRVFVTGTDTDAGKTVVSAWLCLHAGADYWKPIQSGHPPDRDADVVARLSGAHIHPERYLLRAPLSGYDAAKREGKRIDVADFHAPETSRPLVIEGAGGVLVPINESATTLDLIERLRVPVVVAARSGLGTINHTCLTLMALRERSVPVIGVVLSGSVNPGNRQAIERFGQTRILGEIPRLDPLDRESLSRITPLSGAMEWIRWRP